MHGRLSTHTNYSFLRARGGGKPLTLAMHCALCTMHCALIMYKRWWEVTHTYYAPSTRELLTLSIEFRDFKNPIKVADSETVSGWCTLVKNLHLHCL